jgi:hypothetical protein
MPPPDIETSHPALAIRFWKTPPPRDGVVQLLARATGDRFDSGFQNPVSFPGNLGVVAAF